MKLLFATVFFFVMRVATAQLPSFYVDQMKVITLINVTGMPNYDSMKDTTISNIHVELYPSHYTITDDMSWSISFQFDGLVTSAQFLTFHYSNVNGTTRAIYGSPVVGEDGLPITEETPAGKTDTTNKMLIIQSNFNAWYEKAGLE